MRICMILEGCYPYVFGGVATWVNQYILSKPDQEFVLMTIGAKKKDKGKFVYDIPKNVVEIKEIFLDEEVKNKNVKKIKYSKEILKEIKNLILGKRVKWDILFKNINSENWDTEQFFRSEEYLNLIIDVAKKELKNTSFLEVFYGMKSMLITLLNMLCEEIPEADIYHTTSTGYAGILGAVAKYRTQKPLVVTEHGIYPREREEELLGSTWLGENLKKTWISFFYNISLSAYEKADRVTSLFENAKRTQILLGCDKNKCEVVPNGIELKKYDGMPKKRANGFIDIGAFIRFSSIKDVKTLLYSFYEAHTQCDKLRLHIFGATNDKEYKKQCLNIIDLLEIKDYVTIYGQINPMEYLPKMDVTILTSISEGQPLTVLESFAANRPAICTNVGCCKELIDGNNDGIGKAGICCTPMDVKEIARAMVVLAKNDNLREEYGKNARIRVEEYYTFDMMMNKYFNIYYSSIK